MRLSLSISALDWVKSTKIGSNCLITASWVASVALASAPSVAKALPMRPEIGAVTLA